MTAHPSPIHSMPAHPLLAGVRDLVAVAGELGELDPAYVSDADKRALLELMPLLHTQIGRLAMRFYHYCVSLAADDGFRDVAQWAAKQTRQAPGVLRADVRLAASLEEWRQTGVALGSGEVNIAQARAITHALDGLVEADAVLRAEGEVGVEAEVFVRAERELIRLAGEFGPRELRKLGNGILSTLAPEVADRHEQAALEAAERRAAAATRLTMRRRGDGTVDVHARISEAAATRLSSLIDAFASPRTGGNEQPSRGFGVTDPATGAKLSAERVRGEAFTGLLEAIDPATIPLQGGGATVVTVTIGLETLQSGVGVGILDDGTSISVSEARRLACQAGILPAVLNGESEVMDYGRSKRLFTWAQRRAHAVLHPTCEVADCDVPWQKCEAHHVDNWAHGGLTDKDKLRFECVHHHHVDHDPDFETRMKPNGTVYFRRIKRQ